MSLTYTTLPGDIDQAIADDHAIIDRQFDHLDAGRGDRRVLVDQISFELALHAFAEETVLYPECERAGFHDESVRAREEHQTLKELLVTLGRRDPGQPQFEDALAQLIATTRHHVVDEEQTLLPAFRRRVGATRMAELGKAFVTAKRQAPAAPHPHAPDHGLAERVAGALAAPIDALRAKASGKTRHLATDASGLLDTQARALIDAWASLVPRPIEILTPAQARLQPGLDAAVKKLLEEQGRATHREAIGAVRDVPIPDAAGGVQMLRVYTPLGAGRAPLPIIMWVHGGGWVVGDVDAYDASCRGVANKAGAVVVAPHYRRAPEHVFPASHHDVLTAWRWTADNAAEVGGDAARAGIGGEGAGAGMAAATILSLLAAAEPTPLALCCVCPLSTIEPFGESMLDAADARPQSRAVWSWMALHAFEGAPDGPADPRVNLLGVEPELLAHLPPTLVITAERDVLRSQGQELARRLADAGVDVVARHYDGVMHDFFGAAAVLDKADDAQHTVARHFLRVFGAASRARAWMRDEHPPV